MKRLLLGNLVAMQLMILSHAALAGLYTVDPWYVDLINLPAGSRILPLLIFGYWVLPGFFIGTALSFIIFSVLGSLHNQWIYYYRCRLMANHSNPSSDIFRAKD